MNRSTQQNGLGAAVIFSASTLLAVTGCGATDVSSAEESTSGSAEEAVSSGWTILTLKTGWVAANGTTPAIGKTNNNVITFRGAVKKDPTKLSNPGAIMFDLPSNVGPQYPDFIEVPIALGAAGNGLGMLQIGCNASTLVCSGSVFEDGVSGGPGTKALAMTSLDGASFDRTSADSRQLNLINGWGEKDYPFRHQGSPIELGAGVKKVGGFVRFQGMLVNNSAPTSLPAFTLPADLTPGQAVYVPVLLAAGSGAAHGRLNIMTDGNVYIQPENNNVTATDFTSIEGASFSLSTTPTALPLSNGWVPYSPRAVKVRNDDGVIRLEGAVKNGSSNVVGNLPSGMRPAQTIYVVADGFGATHLRLKFETNGNISVDPSALSSAQGFLSLDGVSFAL